MTEAREDVTPYDRLQDEARRALGTAVVDAAARIIAEEGPAACTMRRVAAAVGASTTVLYTRFGGKSGLAEGVYLDGFDRIHRAMAAIPSDGDPFADMVQVGLAYRRFARENPALYAVMFHNAIPTFTPSAAAVQQARRGLEVFVAAVRRCVDAGILRGDPAELGELLWAAGHGVVSLELAGHFPDEDVALRRFMSTTGTVVWAFRTDEARWLL